MQRRRIAIELERQIDDLTVSGRADLLLGQAPGVLDIKWGSASRHRTALTSGTAFQLAVYGRLVGTDEGVAPSAYYVVTTRTLLTTSATSLARGTLDGPTPRDTWAAFRQALDARRAELRDGVAHSCARAAGEAMPTSAIEDGRLRLEPGCRFCQHLHLCGGRRD